MPESVDRMSDVLRELRDEIISLRSELHQMRKKLDQKGIAPPARRPRSGWEGLKLEIMQILCDAEGGRMNSQEITESIPSFFQADQQPLLGRTETVRPGDRVQFPIAGGGRVFR